MVDGGVLNGSEAILLDLLIFGNPGHPQTEDSTLSQPRLFGRDSGAHGSRFRGHGHGIKWSKTQAVVEKLWVMFFLGVMSFKSIKQIRCFLIYVSQTYKWMTHFLKGIHLTIDGWWPN